MLKKRIIPVQLLLNERLVKTEKFDKWRDVGDPVKSSQVYNSQYADELIFLNIDRDGGDVQGMGDLIEKVSEVSFMPLAIGGGIRTFEDAAFLIKRGADKVVLNSIAYDEPGIISKISERFGIQAVIVGIDAIKDENTGGYQPVSNCGKTLQYVELEEHIKRVISFGAGEIMIQSIDRDGTMAGYDVELINLVMQVATVPVIACGGSGNYDHLKEAFLETNVSALACGSLFNFSDSNPMRAKNFLSNYGIPFKKV